MKNLKVIAILMLLLVCSFKANAKSCVAENTSYENLIEYISQPESNEDEDCQAYHIFKAASMVEIDIKIAPREYKKKIEYAISRYERNPFGFERFFYVLQQKWFQASANLLLLRARDKVFAESVKIGAGSVATIGLLLALPFRKWSLKGFRMIKEIALNRLYPYRFLAFGGASVYSQTRSENSKLADLDKDIRGVLLRSPYEFMLKENPEPEKPIDEVLIREFYDEILAIGVVGVAAGTAAGHVVSRVLPKSHWLDLSQKLPVSPATRRLLDRILGHKIAGAAKPAALVGLVATVAFTHYTTSYVQEYQSWSRYNELKKMMVTKIALIKQLTSQGQTYEAWKNLEEIRGQTAIYRALFINHIVTDIVQEIEDQFDSIKSAAFSCSNDKIEIDKKQLKKFAKNLKSISKNNKVFLAQNLEISTWLFDELGEIQVDFVQDFRLELSRNAALDEDMINPTSIFKQYSPILTEYLSGLNCVPEVEPDQWLSTF